MKQESADQRVKAARLKYVGEWDITSAGLEADGHYDWMAGFVAGFARILEIGTGTGRSTLALLRHGHSVVGVDENRECLRKAKDLIRAAGYSADVYERGKVIDAGPHRYKVSYKPITAPRPTSDAYFVVGDVCGTSRSIDVALDDWLSRIGPFNAVVCWLIGTHMERKNNMEVVSRGIGSDAAHRLAVQNRVYETADRVLRSGGVLHVVDRGKPNPTASEQTEFVEAHREQASVTSLQVESQPTFRPYTPAGSGCTLIYAMPGAQPGQTDATVSLASIRAFKL